MSNNPILEIKGLKKVFTEDLEQPLEVLKNINLEVEEGEFISLMGESGSGKSTLLYQIGALDTPTEGTILIGGENIHKANDKQQSIFRRDNIGFVFQFYNLVSNLTVKENIILPAVMAKKAKKEYEENLNYLLNTIGLANKKNNLPKQLSGGEQQRVAIARALIMNPKLVLADEPTGNLDSKSTMEIMKLFQRINKEKNVTIIQVTHSEITAKYSSRIIYLKDGQIVSGEEIREDEEI
jgi:putative ABC transport system ATP-binding protein